MGQAALSAHAPGRADQPGVRLVCLGGSDGGGEEGGAGRGGHALARRARKEMEGGGTRGLGLPEGGGAVSNRLAA